MERYLLLSGETLHLEEMSPELAAFMAQAHAAVSDDAVSSQAMVVLLFSDENPLLQPGLSPGRGLVTQAVACHPAFRVMWDLLDRKRIEEGSLSEDAATSPFQVSVADAAQQLGITTAAVRQAIGAGRLQSRKFGGRAHWLRQADVDTLRVRGRSTDDAEPLMMAIGSDDTGRHLSVRFDAEAVLTRTGRQDNVVRAEVFGWREVAVKGAGPDGGSRYFELRPAQNAFEVLHHGPVLNVTGAFEVVVTENNASQAAAAWKTFLARHQGSDQATDNRHTESRSDADSEVPLPGEPTA